MFSQNKPNMFTGFGQQATGNFGSTSTPAFGTQSTNTPVFGAVPSTSTGTGLFGGPPTSSASLFGSPPTPPTFGGQQTSSPFGVTTSSLASPFGTQTTPLFGPSTPQTSTSSLFSQRPYGTFAQTTASTANLITGTGQVKFLPLQGNDTMIKDGVNRTIQTRHQCINAMKEYENKSMEELRWEDYQANRKGPTTTGPFGSSSIGTSLFNTQASTTPFSSVTNSIFGPSKAQTPFGPVTTATTTTTTSIFNTQTAFNKTTPFNTTSTFAPQPQQTPSFATPQQAATPFNTTPGTSLFNNPTPNFPSTGIFSPPSAANQVRPPFNFAPQTTSAASIFSQNTANTLAKPTFPTPPASTTSNFANSFSFSNPTTTSSVFSSSIFNTATNTANKTFNFNTAIQPAPFGTTSTAMPQFNANSTGLFSSPTTNMFSLGQTNPGTSLFSNPLQPNQVATPVLSLQQSVSYQLPASDLLLNRLQTMPYGDSPLFQNNLTQNQNQPIKFSTDSKTMYQYKIGQKTASAPKVPRNMNINQLNTSLLFDGLDEENSDEKKTASDLFAPRRNIKRLVLKPKDSDLNSSTNGSPATQTPQRQVNLQSKENIADNTISELCGNKSTSPASPSSPQIEPTSSPVDPSQSFLAGSSDESTINLSSSVTPLKCGVRLTKPDYYTVPPYNELDKYYDAVKDTCIVPSFTIGREGYGSIHWEDPVDIKDLNLDFIVHIRRKEVIVYPDDETKPEVGSGINKPAQITLHQVWPVDKTTHEIIKDAERLKTMKYAEKIEIATVKLGATFKDYRPDTGSWVFCVRHFSKYGLVDDENEEEEESEIRPNKVDQLRHQQQLMNNSEKSDRNSRGDLRNEMELDSREDLEFNVKEFSNDPSFSEEIEGTFEEPFDMYPSYYDSMRYAFFPEDDDAESFDLSSQFKKPKRTIHQDEKKPKEMSDLFTSYVPKIAFIKKRDLHLETETFPAKEKLIADISSLHLQVSPKIRFFNGTSNFTFISGKSVKLYNLNLIPDVVSHVSRFEAQLLENSQVTVQPGNLPFIETKPKAHNKHNIQQLERLIEAYYGDLNEPSEYGQHHERSNHVIDWLSEQNSLLKKPKEITSRILYYMCCNDLKSAVDEAFQAKYPKLALLICSGNNTNVKASLIKQLESWRKNGADHYIDKELLKIYVVLSGGLKWITSSNLEIDALENLSWTQQLCLMLVFSSHRGLPECIKNLTVKTDDVEYHILAGHSPFDAVDAASNHLEAWFLHQSLQSYKVIQDDIRSDLVHMVLWSQLVSKNVALACYVAAHISNDLLREQTLCDAITYYAPKFKPQDDNWLTQSLNIYPQFIAKMKSIYYRCRFDFEKHAILLLEAEEWSQAHDAFVENIFPELVINEDQATLRQIIDKLKPHQEAIPNWYSNGANVYDIYSRALINQSDANLDEFNIHLIKCNSIRQILCRSEMARRMNNILVSLRGELYPLDSPIPPDYVLKELRYNSRLMVALLSQR